MREIVPEDRRWAYPVRKVIETIADTGSFIELRRIYGRPVVTGFMRLEGKPVGLIANDCQQLGGAVDSEAAEKAAKFLRSCNAFNLPVISFTDTPGFMVGPNNEREAAVRRMSELFLAGANLTVPVVAVFLRKGYGLGAMAMVGGSFLNPVYSASWPTGEFGGMGLEGAVRLGYKKELEAIADDTERQALFDKLVARAYEIGKALPSNEYPIVDVPLSHPIFRVLYDVKKVPQITSIQHWRRVGGRNTSERGAESAIVNFRAITDHNGRVMVLMSHNTDIADGWERENEDWEFFDRFSADAYALAINVVLYAMMH